MCKSTFPYGDPHTETGIRIFSFPIRKRGFTVPIWGIKPFVDPRMETGSRIFQFPIWKRGCVNPRFHMEIPIWKRDPYLSYLRMETVISVSVWVSRYLYGDSLYGNFRLCTFYEFVGGTMCELPPSRRLSDDIRTTWRNVLTRGRRRRGDSTSSIGGCSLATTAVQWGGRGGATASGPGPGRDPVVPTAAAAAPSSQRRPCLTTSFATCTSTRSSTVPTRPCTPATA